MKMLVQRLDVVFYEQLRQRAHSFMCDLFFYLHHTSLALKLDTFISPITASLSSNSL